MDPEELKSDLQAPLVAGLEKAVEAGDRPAILKAYEGLGGLTRHLADEHARAVRRASTKALKAFLDAEDFDGLLKVAGSSLVPSETVYHALNDVCGELDTPLLLGVVRAKGFPPSSSLPFYKELVSRDDPEVTRGVIAWIVEESKRFAKDGAPFRRHMKLFSTWMMQLTPDDAKLGPALGVLAQRGDPEAGKALLGFLDDLPWGEDRCATALLLKALLAHKIDGAEEAISGALDRRSEPSAVREYLLRALFDFDRERGLRLAVGDLAKDAPGEERTEQLDLIESFLSLLEDKKLLQTEDGRQAFIAPNEPVFKDLKTGTWGTVARGQLLDLLIRRFPRVDRAPLAGWKDHLNHRIMLSFQLCRVDHMAWIIVLPLMLAGGYAFLWLLDKVLGAPRSPWSILDDMALFFWMLTVLGTSTTHFSGLETRRDVLGKARMFWLAAFLFPGAALILRVAFLAAG